MTGIVSGAIRDVRTLQQRMQTNDRAARDALESDVVLDGPRRLMLRSPNGTYFSVTVDNAGALHTVNLGTSL
ncbi:hypothetical protein D3Y57_07070 [Sphingomonas paeninsulae]|uniref:Uncharacterized protein n=1 Tax=Sphingomonas paeninsulae TaxID=2319844 RepID=A0A494T8V3_SPHPE|nr:hypothetical protein [Sphingomonas paeninsulae]AYJ85779.1 hypothetical protein D3Y57_07070 [Sphingomonas paeninsulae]